MFASAGYKYPRSGQHHLAHKIPEGLLLSPSSCSKPLQPTGMVAPSGGGCAPHLLFCGCPWFSLLRFAQADTAPPTNTYCLPVPWFEVPRHKICWAKLCRCQPATPGQVALRSLYPFNPRHQEPAERFQLSPENSIIFPGHPSWGGEGRRRPLRWLMLLSQADVSWLRLARAQRLCG